MLPKCTHLKHISRLICVKYASIKYARKPYFYIYLQFLESIKHKYNLSKWCLLWYNHHFLCGKLAFLSNTPGGSLFQLFYSFILSPIWWRCLNRHSPVTQSPCPPHITISVLVFFSLIQPFFFFLKRVPVKFWFFWFSFSCLTCVT